MADSKITIKSADMEEQLQNEIVEIATAAFTEFKIEKDIASHIKRECDKKFGPTWHAVVGKNFGSYVTHETHFFIYFYYEKTAVLLFKTG